MFPWGTIVGLAGQAVSGIASAYNNKRMQQAADSESEYQQAYYNAKANENPLARSENARLLANYDRKAQQQIDQAQGIATITGATPEYMLGVQKGVADGRASLMGTMAGGASERKDKFEEKAENARHQKILDDQQRRADRNTTYANLAANAASAAGSIIDAYQPKPLQDEVAPLQAPTTQVKTTTPPTTYQSEVDKMNTQLAKIKNQ